jgi:hypothetical protein
MTTMGVPAAKTGWDGAAAATAGGGWIDGASCAFATEARAEQLNTNAGPIVRKQQRIVRPPKRSCR